jgi:hypothetical protein
VLAQASKRADRRWILDQGDRCSWLVGFCGRSGSALVIPLRRIPVGPGCLQFLQALGPDVLIEPGRTFTEYAL